MQTLCLALLVPGFWNGNYNINSTSYLQAAQPVHEGAGNSGTHIHKINNKAFLIRMDFFLNFLLGTDQNFLVLSGFKNQTKENMTLPFPSPHSGKKDHSDLYVQPSHTV